METYTRVQITESEFADTIEQALNLFGWRWIHSRPAKTDKGWRTALSGTEGFPDYFATRDGKSIAFELKSDIGVLSLEQYFWLLKLQESGIDTYLWQPRDNFEDILSVLR